MPAHPHLTTRRLALALTAATALALSACGGGDDQSTDEPSTPAGSSAAPLYSPLTGEQVEQLPDRPIVAVKIDNSHASAPQAGLGSADLVTEELVEGGITRLAVFFDSRIPKVVGPVRSMRATDIGILQPAKAVLVASGGAGQTVSRIKAADIRTFTEGAPGFYRDTSRSAPYNLFMHLDQLVRTLESGSRPSSYLPFGDASDFPGGQRASGLDATFSPGHTTTWVYQGGHYVNTNSNAASADRFLPDTVLVLRVQVGDAGYLDPAGNHVPETKFTGKGAAMVFHGGKLVRGTWSKAGYDATVKLSTAGGSLTLPPGKVWIELVPANGGNVTVRK